MKPSKQDIIDAAARIRPYIHTTPILTSQLLNELAECRLFFKCENLQKSGSFKVRGAGNAILSLSEKQLEKGVATHSSGNHAQAVALMAKYLGKPAYIAMPENASKVKVEAVKSYHGNIWYCKPTLKAREDTLKEIVAKTGATFIPPYDDFKIIAGQATATWELLQEIERLDFVLTPVGGGGLLSGAVLSALYFAPHVQLIGCEPKGADDAYRSFKTGERVPSINPDTLADGLLTSLGLKNFSIIKEHVSDIITVSDDQILEAMRLLLTRMKLVVEPSAAVPLAVALANKERFRGKKVGILLSGGNVDTTQWF